jgi:hypothetical protein
MKARIISIVVIAMLLGVSSAQAASFTDIKGHWGESTIKYWSDNNLISGYSDGTFRPDITVSRVEMVSLINKAFKFTKEDETSFKDVPDGIWFHSQVGIAKAYGYVDGYPDDTFKPNKSVTRQEMAEMIQKILRLPEPPVSKEGSKPVVQGAMGAALTAQIIKGYPDGQLKPNAAVTRIEAMVILDNALRYSQLNTLSTGSISASGTYGPIAGLADIQNKVFNISAKSVTLRNLYFNGDIIITSDVDSDVTFDNVVVRGKVQLQGNKSGKINIIDSSMNTIEANGSGGTTSIKSIGTTSIRSTLISADTILGSDVNTPFDSVEVTTKFPKLSVLQVDAGISELKISAESTLKSTTGIINSLTVLPTALNVKMELGELSKVKSMVLNSDVSVKGKGKIDGVLTTTMGSTFETQPSKMESTIPPVLTVSILAKITEALTLYNAATEGTTNGSYALGSKAILKAEIDLTQALVDSKTKTQASVDTKLNTLNTAIAVFNSTKIIIVNTSALQLKIQEVTNKLTPAIEGTGFGEYSIGSKALLLSANTVATAKLNSASKIQSDYDIALVALNSAVDTFDKSKVGAGDATILNTKINEASLVLSGSIEGVGPSEYPVGSKATLQAAVDVARAVNNAASSKSQLQFNSTVVSLQSSLDTFRASKNTITDSDIVLAETTVYNTLVTLSAYDILTDVTTQVISTLPGKTPSNYITLAIMSVRSIDGTPAQYLSLNAGIISIAQNNVTSSTVSEQVIIQLTKGASSISIPITVLIPVYVQS